ncbi:MAG: NAD(P)-binding protein, partial [Ginsengibacter sp.]
MTDPLKIELFDAAIIGGGLAGLSLSILLAKESYRVVLFEKEKYPFHKVCGEYISLESWNFINGLGLNLNALNLHLIKRLQITSPAGHSLEATLDLGGFGISRYYIDNELKKIAESLGVLIHDGTKVNEVVFKEDMFLIKHNGGEMRSKTA